VTTQAAEHAETDAPLGRLFFERVLSPHRSLPPRGFHVLMLALGLISLAVGIGFVAIGAWPVFGFFGLGYVLYCAGQATGRMGASVFAALLRAAIAVLGGFAVIWLKADVTWNFVAVAIGMVAFGLFALPPLIRRSGYQ